MQQSIHLFQCLEHSSLALASCNDIRKRRQLHKDIFPSCFLCLGRHGRFQLHSGTGILGLGGLSLGLCLSFRLGLRFLGFLDLSLGLSLRSLGIFSSLLGLALLCGGFIICVGIGQWDVGLHGFLVFFLLLLELLFIDLLVFVTELLPFGRCQLRHSCHWLTAAFLHESSAILRKETAVRTPSWLLRSFRVLLLLDVLLAFLLGGFLLTSCFQECLHVFIILGLGSHEFLLVDFLVLFTESLKLLRGQLGDSCDGLSFALRLQFWTFLGQELTVSSTCWLLWLFHCHCKRTLRTRGRG
mmetsp:Transcript_42321/g.69921  ORF Transcript_42321/g.69921 Transcript_42321/m.69921 type:complete len:298 (-) Transcript_42321:35-928(-)